MKDYQDESKGRRSFLFRGLELVSTIPLIGLFLSNYSKNRTLYQPETSKALLTEKPANVREFSQIQESLQRATQNLAEEYKDAYYNPHDEVYTTMDNKGNVSVHTRTVWEWEEPRNVPDHIIVERWNRAHSRISKKAQDLEERAVIDIGNLNRMATIERTDTNSIGSKIGTTAMYSALVLGLLGYEEAVAQIVYSNDYSRYRKKKSMAEKMKDINTTSQINRRSLLKIGAALAGAGVAKLVGDHNNKKAEKGRIELKTVFANTSDRFALTPEDSFQEYFESNPQQITANTADIVKTARNTLESGVREEKVKAAFENVIRQGREYLGRMQDFFGDGVPEDFARTANYARSTEMIEETADNLRTRNNLGPVLEALAVAGTLAGIIIPGEIINNKLLK